MIVVPLGVVPLGMGMVLLGMVPFPGMMVVCLNPNRKVGRAISLYVMAVRNQIMHQQDQECR